MTAVNHALTGAAIGLIVGEPLIALPAALASHFACDALPHFGSSLPAHIAVKKMSFRNYLIAEAGLCFLIVLCLGILQPEHWQLACTCAFLATSPDLLWVNKYIKMRRDESWQRGIYATFADSIQWFAKPIGAVVEAAWFIAAVVILMPFMR